MLVEGIKSRPVYGKLEARPGALHLLVLEGYAAGVAVALTVPPDFFAKAFILFIPRDATPLATQLQARKPKSYQEHPTLAAAEPALRQLLTTAVMGTQLYVAGTEPFIGTVVRLAEEAGIRHGAVQTEHHGSLCRRVQCVHCKGITEDVKTQPVACAHCGLTLLVRDHYSRRIGAFQGVCIDAEEPGTAPPTEEVFG